MFFVKAAKSRHGDARMSVMNEAVEGVRTVKLYAWEGAFGQAVAAVRRRDAGLVDTEL